MPAVLIEELMSQFRTFGEGLQLVNDKIDRVEQKVNRGFIDINNRIDGFDEKNRHEHQQLKQMIQEPSA